MSEFDKTPQESSKHSPKKIWHTVAENLPKKTRKVARSIAPHILGLSLLLSSGKESHNLDNFTSTSFLIEKDATPVVQTIHESQPTLQQQITQTVSQAETLQENLDILSDAELEKLNIYITPTESVKLQIGKQGLYEEPLLKRALQKSFLYPMDPRFPAFKLHVVLLDTAELSENTIVPPSYNEIYSRMFSQLTPEQRKRGAQGIFTRMSYSLNNSAYNLIDLSQNKMLSGQDAEREEYYIFLGVGGTAMPRLQQSFPSPTALGYYSPTVTTAETYWKSKGYTFLPIRRPTGFGLRHEFKHYSESNESHVEFDEMKTDIAAYNSIMSAFAAFRENGDRSLYYFKFITPEGIIYTHDKRLLYKIGVL